MTSSATSKLVDDFTLKLTDATAGDQHHPRQYYQSRSTQKQPSDRRPDERDPHGQLTPGTISHGTKNLATGQTDRDDAVKALAAISTTPDLVFSAEGTPVIRKTRVVKTAAAAVVAGFPLAIGIVLLLDALQRRRQARRAAQAERETFPVSEDESEVPVAAGAALLVGSRASPGPVAGAEPMENGRSAHIAAKEPALLVGARTATATAAVMDEDDEDDDEPDDEGQPGPLGSAEDEDELDVDELVAVDISDDED